MRSKLQAAAIAAAIVLLAGCATSPTPSWSLVPAPSSSPGAQTSASPPSSASPSPAAASWSFVKKEACADSEFECITLAVPRDHFAASGPTWQVTFGIHRAKGTPKGTWVNVTGGPGTSGLAVADSYTEAFPEGMADAYDVVFIDQRGVGRSEPIQCPEATAVYYGSTARPQDPAQRDAVAAAAKTYVSDCIAETGADEADLPFYATRQAVEDLEAVRQYLAVDKLHLYGESYGTQFVQTYAAAHPDHIAALFVDGPVDLTLDWATSWVEATRAFDDVLAWTLDTCTADGTCAADMAGGDALAAYDALAERLGAAPAPFDYPMPDGTVQARTLTIADLENAAVTYLYSPSDRLLFERALASASQGDLVPLARLAYEGIAVDPDALDVVPDETWSDAMYYAVECQDYVLEPGATDPDAALTATLDRAAGAGIDELRLGSVYYGDLPCLYWPGAPTTDVRPAPIVDQPYPLFVLVGTGDPITPASGATRIYARTTNAHLLLTDGGPHIIFGWGEACPDEVVGAYLLGGTLPPTQVTLCDGAVVDDYVGVAPPTAAGYKDALDVVATTDDTIVNADDYWYRLEDEPLKVGCDFGGTVTYTPTDTGTDLALAACEYTEGVPVTGTGAIDDESGGLTMKVTVPDGSLDYARDGDGNRSVTGTYQGRSVDLSG